MHNSDLDLVKNYIQKNDISAFEQLYLKYVKDVFRFVYSRVGRKDIAEDIVSDTFLSLLDLLKNFDTERSTNVKSFIIGISFNKIRQYKQKYLSNNQIDIDDEILDDELDELDEAIIEGSEELKLKVRQVVESLDSPQKEVIKMRFFESKTVLEVAQELKLTEANVRVIQHRTLEKLKILIKL